MLKASFPGSCCDSSIRMKAKEAIQEIKEALLLKKAVLVKGETLE